MAATTRTSTFPVVFGNTTLIARHDADAGARIIVPELTADCPRRDSAALMERCAILFPELRALFPPR